MDATQDVATMDAAQDHKEARPLKLIWRLQLGKSEVQAGTNSNRTVRVNVYQRDGQAFFIACQLSRKIVEGSGEWMLKIVRRLLGDAQRQGAAVINYGGGYASLVLVDGMTLPALEQLDNLPRIGVDLVIVRGAAGREPTTDGGVEDYGVIWSTDSVEDHLREAQAELGAAAALCLHAGVEQGGVVGEWHDLGDRKHIYRVSSHDDNPCIAQLAHRSMEEEQSLMSRPGTPVHRNHQENHDQPGRPLIPAVDDAQEGLAHESMVTPPSLAEEERRRTHGQKRRASLSDDDAAFAESARSPPRKKPRRLSHETGADKDSTALLEPPAGMEASVDSRSAALGDTQAGQVEGKQVSEEEALEDTKPRAKPEANLVEASKPPVESRAEENNHDKTHGLCETQEPETGSDAAKHTAGETSENRRTSMSINSAKDDESAEGDAIIETKPAAALTLKNAGEPLSKKMLPGGIQRESAAHEPQSASATVASSIAESTALKSAIKRSETDEAKPAAAAKPPESKKAGKPLLKKMLPGDIQRESAAQKPKEGSEKKSALEMRERRKSKSTARRKSDSSLTDALKKVQSTLTGPISVPPGPMEGGRGVLRFNPREACLLYRAYKGIMSEEDSAAKTLFRGTMTPAFGKTDVVHAKAVLTSLHAEIEAPLIKVGHSSGMKAESVGKNKHGAAKSGTKALATTQNDAEISGQQGRSDSDDSSEDDEPLITMFTKELQGEATQVKAKAPQKKPKSRSSSTSSAAPASEVTKTKPNMKTSEATNASKSRPQNAVSSAAGESNRGRSKATNARPSTSPIAPKPEVEVAAKKSPGSRKRKQGSPIRRMKPPNGGDVMGAESAEPESPDANERNREETKKKRGRPKQSKSKPKNQPAEPASQDSFVFL